MEIKVHTQTFIADEEKYSKMTMIDLCLAGFNQDDSNFSSASLPKSEKKKVSVLLFVEMSKHKYVSKIKGKEKKKGMLLVRKICFVTR